MAVKTKVIITILALLVVGGGAFAYFILTSDKGENILPDMIQEETWVYPYSGQKTTDEQATKMRPFCIKMPNDIKARPHTGINSADVVYETMVEGGETRLNVIYQSDIPKEVGPVRSARLSDIWIVPQYDGMLFFSGANAQVRGEIASNDLTDMRWDYAESIYFRSDNGRGNLHNLHIKLNEAYGAAEKRDYETSSSALQPLHFYGVNYDDAGEADSKLDSMNDEATSGSSVEIRIATISDIKFKWNEKLEKYLKWMNGVEHKDAVDEKQVNVDNVVVLWAEYTQQSMVDAAGSPTYDTNLGGSGKAAVFKDGMRYDCEWKADATTPPRFFDSSGNEVLLNPGKTWIVVPPTNIEITSE